MTSWPIDPADVAAGLVDGDEATQADALMSSDPAFRAEVERLRAVVARLERLPDDAWERHELPPLDVDALPGRAQPARRSRRWSPARLVPLTAAFAAAVLVAVLWTARDGGRDDVRTIQLDALNGTRGAVAVAIGDDSAKLTAKGLPVTDANHHYEAWLGDPAGQMISMGTFTVDSGGTARVSMPLPVNLAKYTLLDVSLEENDGNPAHSAVSVFRHAL